MADSRLRVATFTSTRTFAKSDQEIANILLWFIADTAGAMPDGLTQAEQNQWRLDQAHNEMLRYVVRKARENRLKMLRAEQGNLEEQAEAETDLSAP